MNSIIAASFAPARGVATRCHRPLIAGVFACSPVSRETSTRNTGGRAKFFGHAPHRPGHPPRFGARPGGPGGGAPRPGGARGGPRERGRFPPRRRYCIFCAEHVALIDYKDVERLRRFVSDRAKMEPPRKTGVCAKHQRELSTAIKRARHLALLPFVPFRAPRGMVHRP